jgi:O-antigen ligase
VTVALAADAGAEVVAALAAALVGAAALLLDDPRRRAAAILAAPVLAAVAVVLLVRAPLTDAVAARPLVAAGAGLVGAMAVGALALLIRRQPASLLLLALAALPFRVPIPVGDDTANLLLPLYAVIAAGCVAFAAGALRGTADVGAGGTPAARRVRIVLAAVITLYALQTLYSTDVEQAVKNLGFFYVPFAVLFCLLLGVPWSAAVARRALLLAAALAVLFAVVGIFEYATGRLLIVNEKVLEANALKPYFRVNSLFFDPNIYGRFLSLAMIGLAGALLWTRRPRDAGVIGAVLAVLWAGLVLSLSQSSLAALLVGLGVLAGVRGRPAPLSTVAAVAAVAATVVIVLAPASVGLASTNERTLNRATSGRVELIGGALEMIADRPLAGFGSGSFAERFRAREHVPREDAAAISHTTPLTVTAEQGVPGLIAYLSILAAAAALLFGGLRSAASRAPPSVDVVARVVVAATFCGLVVHTLIYAAFLEDPLAWLLLAAGASLHRT